MAGILCGLWVAVKREGNHETANCRSTLRVVNFPDGIDSESRAGVPASAGKERPPEGATTNGMEGEPGKSLYGQGRAWLKRRKR